MTPPAPTFCAGKRQKSRGSSCGWMGAQSSPDVSANALINRELAGMWPLIGDRAAAFSSGSNG